ncbi:nuclear intron maturase 4, mitochondrial-like isoform X2 [Spinacia oleracea]|uniref:Nuclear intron maturase 4, mitochondrial-like isoform X2 n=1 Tax=Spinacia oleracea TaxID=3562 RepID=A0ABM3R6R3_SPIOL|nr:nuclear intron maturase 4, mitochondrial-like isoform X2 [Spinacia oleracea]
MWFLRFLNFSRKGFFFHGFSTAKASAINTQLRAAPRFYLGRTAQAYLSTLQEAKNDVEKMPLAKSLASLVVESSPPGDVKDTDRPEMGRVGMKRLFEMRVKKRVKQQYMNGRFSDLFMKVVADPKTLMDAYNCIRVCSNVDVATWEDSGICFESLAEDLANGRFDVEANTCTVSTRGGTRKEVLVLPNLKLKVVQEALRIVLEVVYKPHFSKISHGGRSGRGHLSAFKYICKEIPDPDWWFTVLVSKKVLNVEFGGFPKGQGLPQEGTLSPILMNIYLRLFDDEFHRMSMRYEALDSSIELDEKQPQSKLRSWFRRQIKCSAGNPKGCENSGVRVYSCRFMDEIFFAVSGPKEASLSLKSEVQNYFQDCLHLDVNRNMEIVSCNHGQGVRFAGALLIRTIKDSPAVRAVHKLKEKVKVFALQKQEIWDAGTARIGKKCLAHGLRKVKESEIRHLSDNNSCLSKISCYRKSGMETDHWYKQLIKIWMQDLEKNAATSEEYILSKCIAEPALPPSLLESFYEFQRRVEEYNSSETDSLLSLLPSSGLSQQCETITKVIAPVNVIQKRLLRYGLVSDKGYSRAVHALILQDSSQIIDWFSGIGHRWLRWCNECENFGELKIIVSEQVRKSCIRTLALKYRIHESEIEKSFGSQLSSMLLSQDAEDGICEDMLDTCSLDNDEALMYGISYSGLCQLSLARMVSLSRPCNCFVMGCSAAAPCVYILHVMERQKFPGWNTGFSSCIHPSLNKRRIGLCKQHLKDLYLGEISLQSIDFGSWKRSIS